MYITLFDTFLKIDVLRGYHNDVRVYEPTPKKKKGEIDPCAEIYKTNIKIFFNEDEKDNAFSLARRIQYDGIADITNDTMKDRIIMLLRRNTDTLSDNAK